MQFKLFPALLVFLGSYFPLALILALQNIDEEFWNSEFCWSLSNCYFPIGDHVVLSTLIILITLSCLLLTIKILSKLRYKYPVQVLTIKPIPSELISYSFPYIVSFMGVDYGSPAKVAGLLVFLIWLFLITYKAGYIIMNPILLVLGWNLYEAEVEINKHKRVVKFLCKNDPVPGTYLCQEVQGNYISTGETK